ncbi:MAG TPA: chlorophyll synthesis pathway protein BchC [Acetobacteraceae bacterium]|nr:chlorophyll synthesis pathway protein BchC [Acetobacteraceae bacterium]
METLAVVLNGPQKLELRRLPLRVPDDGDLVVDIAWSGISTGTERLLWQGRMPYFPGMGYPLVPGYEAVGRVVAAPRDSAHRIDDAVFVPGAACFGEIKGLFGAAAARLVVPASRAVSIDSRLGERAVLLALAATAYHALAAPGASRPDLIVGHGVLGRLLARLAVSRGGAPPVIWETNADRMGDPQGYQVRRPEQDERRNYNCIVDASGDPAILDNLIARLALGGEIVLAGFYADRLSFAFPPAFMREARLRVAAEFRPEDLAAVCRMLQHGRLSLDGLITHRMSAADAPAAYQTAFDDPACLKMILDWRACA